MSGCVLVRGVVWCGSPFLFSFLIFFFFLWVGRVGVCVVGWVGLGCVDVWAGWQSLLVDVAAPQRGDQVKQVF